MHTQRVVQLPEPTASTQWHSVLAVGLHPLQVSACTRTHSRADYKAHVSSLRSKAVASTLVEEMDSKYNLIFTHSTTRAQSSPGDSMPW